MPLSRADQGTRGEGKCGILGRPSFREVSDGDGLGPHSPQVELCSFSQSYPSPNAELSGDFVLEQQMLLQILAWKPGKES